MEEQDRKDLLEAVKEFDRLADPLDLTSGGLHLEWTKAAEAIKAGRKLSRLARAAATPPDPGDEAEPPGIYGEHAP